MLRVILLFVLSTLSTQTWSYTFSPTYVYDAKECFCVDRNTEFVVQKRSYDDKLNSFKPVNFLQVDIGDEKTLGGSFLAFIDSFPGAKRIPNGKAFPDRPLPRDTHGNPIPETNAPHTQLGTRTGRKGTYPQAREFDGNGNPVRDIDFTNHDRANHPNPHQHQYIPNATGGTPKRGPTEPLQYP